MLELIIVILLILWLLGYFGRARLPTGNFIHLLLVLILILLVVRLLR